jgi:hypothetical protein
MMVTRRTVGSGLVIVAIAARGSWTLWSRTRTWCPVDEPLLLAKGSTTTSPEFLANVSGPYEVIVEARRTDAVPVDTLACLMGVKGFSWQASCTTPSVLDLSWALARDNGVVARGTSAEEGGAGLTADNATRTIGRFVAARGERYRLSVVMQTDSTSLTAAEPRLRVQEGGTQYESSLVAGGLIRWVCGGLAALGGLLILSTMMRARRTP